MKSEVVPVLIELSGDERSGVRSAATSALAIRVSPEVMPALIERVAEGLLASGSLDRAAFERLVAEA